VSVYKRGGVYWYKFLFQGQLIRESAKTTSKAIAREAERARRHDLELGYNRIARRERLPLFEIAAKEWLESKGALSPLGRVYYEQYSRKLVGEFSSRLVASITVNDIAALQQKRLAEGLSARTVNCEIATLRQILKHYGCWVAVASRVRFLREKADTGKALAVEEADRLLAAIEESPSPALYPLFLLSLDAGLRPSESRALRRTDLAVRWVDGAIAEGEVIVTRSKTEAGSGRVVPLTSRARRALTRWLLRFPDASPDSYVFPFHRVGFAGNARKAIIWEVNLSRPMGQWSYSRSFETAKRKSGVECRFYDARHTFVTRLAENPAVSVETIRQLVGHVSEKMLARYAPIRIQARRDAIATLEGETESQGAFLSAQGWAQNWAQSGSEQGGVLDGQTQKASKKKDLRLVGAAGFEPATTRTPSVCATRLRHAPTVSNTASNDLRPTFRCQCTLAAHRHCSPHSGAVADRCAACSIASAPMTTLSGR
jgi:integrase